MRHLMSLGAVALLAELLLGSSSLHAAAIAADNAGNPSYADGWQASENSGVGFQPWIGPGNSAGGGFGGGFLSTGNGAVNIGSGANNAAFGIYGNAGGVGEAIRPFTGALNVGQTFELDMDNQGIDNGGTVGFGLQNSAGENLVEFYFVGGTANYAVNGSAVLGTLPGYTAGGLHVSLLLGPANSFVLTADPLGPTLPSVVTGTLLSPAGGSAIDRVRLFNANGGPDVFFNNLAVAPEPTTLGLLAATAVLGRRRRA